MLALLYHAPDGLIPTRGGTPEPKTFHCVNLRRAHDTAPDRFITSLCGTLRTKSISACCIFPNRKRPELPAQQSWPATSSRSRPGSNLKLPLNLKREPKKPRNLAVATAKADNSAVARYSLILVHASQRFPRHIHSLALSRCSFSTLAQSAHLSSAKICFNSAGIVRPRILAQPHPGSVALDDVVLRAPLGAQLRKIDAAVRPAALFAHQRALAPPLPKSSASTSDPAPDASRD